MKTFAEINESETPIQDIILDVIPQRGLTENELTERYCKQCDKLRILPLWGQLATALRALRKANKVEIITGKDDTRRVFKKD